MSKMGQYVYDKQFENPDKGIDLSGLAEDQAYTDWSEQYDQETQEKRGDNHE